MLVSYSILALCNRTIRQIITKDKVCSRTDGEDDEEDGAQTQIPHGTGVWTGTGALHPDLQGPLSAQALLTDGREGLVGIAVVMHHCEGPLSMN